MPTSYTSLSIASLTTATSFIYKGTELSTTLSTYQPIINTYTVSGATGGSMSFSSGTLTLNMPSSYTSLSIASLTTATSFIYEGTELSTTWSTLGATYLPLAGGVMTGNLTVNLATVNSPLLELLEELVIEFFFMKGRVQHIHIH